MVTALMRGLQSSPVATLALLGLKMAQLEIIFNSCPEGKIFRVNCPGAKNLGGNCPGGDSWGKMFGG